MNSRTGRKYSHSDRIITKCQDIIILVFSPAIKLKNILGLLTTESVTNTLKKSDIVSQILLD